MSYPRLAPTGLPKFRGESFSLAGTTRGRFRHARMVNFSRTSLAVSDSSRASSCRDQEGFKTA